MQLTLQAFNDGNWQDTCGDILWYALCDSLACYGDPQYFKDELCQLAASLQTLPERLQQRGVPTSILTMPVMGFTHLQQRLQNWGLTT
ncbi:hypothetical protein [Arsukibacterium sp.]|uniref:hypothetical protein n=1 Tax=Arsukibacterium sp. TaxID=1977258 RepID=UPI00299F11AD|nr:hypothetical protein [Arsukibacterium sp.]MDX1539713.1 hypothetical protein [Arsukibacterium sp.]